MLSIVELKLTAQKKSSRAGARASRATPPTAAEAERAPRAAQEANRVSAGFECPICVGRTRVFVDFAAVSNHCREKHPTIDLLLLPPPVVTRPPNRTHPLSWGKMCRALRGCVALRECATTPPPPPPLPLPLPPPPPQTEMSCQEERDALAFAEPGALLRTSTWATAVGPLGDDYLHWAVFDSEGNDCSTCTWCFVVHFEVGCANCEEGCYECYESAIEREYEREVVAYYGAYYGGPPRDMREDRFDSVDPAAVDHDDPCDADGDGEQCDDCWDHDDCCGSCEQDEQCPCHCSECNGCQGVCCTYCENLACARGCSACDGCQRHHCSACLECDYSTVSTRYLCPECSDTLKLPDWSKWGDTDMDWAAANTRDLVTAISRKTEFYGYPHKFADYEELLRRKSGWGTAAEMWAGATKPQGESDGTWDLLKDGFLRGFGGPQWAVHEIECWFDLHGLEQYLFKRQQGIAQLGSIAAFEASDKADEELPWSERCRGEWARQLQQQQQQTEQRGVKRSAETSVALLEAGAGKERRGAATGARADMATATIIPAAVPAALEHAAAGDSLVPVNPPATAGTTEVAALRAQLAEVQRELRAAKDRADKEKQRADALEEQSKPVVIDLADGNAGEGADGGVGGGGSSVAKGSYATASGIALQLQCDDAVREVKLEKGNTLQAKQQLQEAERAKGEAEQQVSVLTGGLDYSTYQRFAQAAQSRAEAERENKGECDICFQEGGNHDFWCNQR